MKSIEEEKETVKRKLGRPKKQNDGLKYYKEQRTRRRINILRFTKNKVEEGVDRGDIINAVIEEYGVSEPTAKRYYQRAMELMTYSMAWDAETIRNKNIQRLDTIVEETIENEDYKNAVTAIDIQNKTASVYIDKKEIAIDGDNITFNFGSGDAN